MSPFKKKPEWEDTVLEALSEGEPLTRAAAKADISTRTVYRKAREDPEFEKRYREARREQREAEDEKEREVAQTCIEKAKQALESIDLNEWTVKDKNGEPISIDGVQFAAAVKGVAILIDKHRLVRGLPTKISEVATEDKTEERREERDEEEIIQELEKLTGSLQREVTARRNGNGHSGGDSGG
jgi:hypothetical protein